MTGLVEQITAFVAGHSTLAYGAIFLIAAAEAFPVLGAILPGSVAIVGLAALIPSGTLALWPMLIAALLGAILGDGVSYWLGHRYRERLMGTSPFSRVSSLVKGNEAIFASHGFKSIFIGRFTPARSIVPVAAGIAGMPVRRFYVANILSAVAWALAHVLPGVLLGAAISVLGAVAGRLAVLAAVVLLVCWLVLLAVRWLLRRLTPLLAGVQARLALRMRSLGRWRVVVLALLDPARPGTQLTLPLLMLPLLGLWLGIAVLVGVAERTGADAAVAALFGSLRTNWADAALGDIALVLGFAAFLGRAVHRHLQHAPVRAPRIGQGARAQQLEQPARSGGDLTVDVLPCLDLGHWGEHRHGQLPLHAWRFQQRPAPGIHDPHPDVLRLPEGMARCGSRRLWQAQLARRAQQQAKVGHGVGQDAPVLGVEARGQHPVQEARRGQDQHQGGAGVSRRHPRDD